MEANTRDDKTKSGDGWMRPARRSSGSYELTGRAKDADESEWAPDGNGQTVTKAA
jgi:hypothetical protein